MMPRHTAVRRDVGMRAKTAGYLLLATFVAGALAALASPRAGAAPDRAAGPGSVDQLPPPERDQTTCAEPKAGQATVRGSTWKAQTFVPGVNGRLVMVDLPGTNGGGTTVLGIRDAAGGCAIRATDIATATVTGGTRFVFAEPPLLRQDAVYALVVAHPAGGSFAWAYSDRPDCYPNLTGTSFTSSNGGARWTRDIDDLHFTTWMARDETLPTPTPAPTAPPQPYPISDQVTCANTVGPPADVRAGTWYGQTFVPGVDGNLLRVTLRGDHHDGVTVLRVRRATGEAVPGVVDVGLSAIRCGSTFVFDAPVALTKGMIYALVVSSTAPSAGYAWHMGGSACYPDGRGKGYTSGDEGRTWRPMAGDLQFGTIMLPKVPTGQPIGDLPPVSCATTPPFPYLVLDRQTCREAPVATVNIRGDMWKAQTFVAGVTGRLKWVALPGAHVDGRTTLHVRATGVANYPTHTDILSATVTCGTVFDLGEGARVEAGRIYALAISNDGGSGGAAGGFHWGYSGRSDCYPDLRATSYTSTDRGGMWSRDTLDIHFQTFVEPEVPGGPPSAPPEATVGCGRPPSGAAEDHPGVPAAPAMAAMPSDAAESPFVHEGRSNASHVSIAEHPSLAAERSPADAARVQRQIDDAVARAEARPPAKVQKTVYIISLPTGTYDPVMLLKKSKDLVALVKEATTFHGYKDPASQPFLEYVIYQDRVFLEPSLPPRCGDEDRNLGSLYAKYGLCDLVKSGAIDEVWLWEGGTGGLPEWATSGPEWSAGESYNLPNCGRQVTLMAFHNGMTLDYALHSLGHRLEGTMRQYRPCDFSSTTWPWPALAAGCRDGTTSDRTGFVARPFAGNDHIGACGDVHTPPNIVDNVGYLYGSPAKAMSICEDWRRDGKAAVKEISCATWGCTQMGFMLWWMQNVPGLDNTSRDRLGQPMPNWWPFYFGRPSPTPAGVTPSAMATSTSTPTPTSTSSSTPTPSPMPTATSTPTSTASPTLTATATSTPADEPTSTPTPPVFRCYVPVALRIDNIWPR